MSAYADRLERESRFHDDRYTTDELRAATTRFYEVGSVGIAAYHSLLAQVPAGCSALEYGCGTGSSACDLAARGISVIGIDISPVAIERAEAEARERELTGARFARMNAEALDLEDASVDLVCGSGILHHLDLERAYAEVARVLTPSGMAMFLEPLGHNPLINLYRRATPQMRSEDEHPLLMQDLVDARRYFGQVEADFFELSTLGLAPLANVPGRQRLTEVTASIDRWLFSRLPSMRRYAWTTLLVLRDPMHR